MTSRSQILDRIRAVTGPASKGTGFSPYKTSPRISGALAPEGHPDLPRTYIRNGSLTTSARIALLIERLREYDADVTVCTATDLDACIAHRLRASGRLTFAAPPGLPASWLAPGFDWKLDNDLSHEQIEHCDGVVTAAFAAIADSGTIVLHHSDREGRRILTLLPDWYLCILRVGQIVETLPEYFDRCSQPPALATYISGPSATADIEMTRIKGVHGPRFLNVIVVHDEAQSSFENN